MSALFRAQGMDAFKTLGMPTTRNEAWRYTSVQHLDIRCDGNVDETSGGVTVLTPPAGIRVCPLVQAWTDDPTVAALMGSVIAPNLDGFTVLSQAYFGDGVFVDVPENFCCEQPLNLVISAKGDVDRHPRVLVRMGARSTLAIVETQSVEELGKDRLCNVVFEAIVGDSAVLNHTRMQEGGNQGTLISRVGIKLGNASLYHGCVATLGGSKVREDLHVDLVGENARCELQGLAMGFAQDHIDHHTCINHRVPHTSSEQAYRAIVGGGATSVYNGRIFVEKDAQKTDSAQSSRNLILSSNATANSKPELEIYADDVRCAHGCTVGRLNDDAMFYLRSRGLSQEQAMHMLTLAFADSVLDASMRDHVHAWLERYLGVEA